MFLYLDAGNTRVKWLASDEEGYLSHIECSGAFDPNVVGVGGALDELLLLCGVDKFALVAFASVRSDDFNLAVASWARRKSDRFASPSVVDWQGFVEPVYEDKAKLGVDRWLAMIASSKVFPDGCAIVSAGTAITVDYVVRGRHVGGLITPGVRMLFESLSVGTSKVKVDDQSISPYSLRVPQIWEPGYDTFQCVQNGVSALLTGLMVEVCRKSRDLGLDGFCFAGGDAEIVSAKLPGVGVKVSVNNNLVLDGLRVWVEYQKVE